MLFEDIRVKTTRSSVGKMLQNEARADRASGLASDQSSAPRILAAARPRPKQQKTILLLTVAAGLLLLGAIGGYTVWKMAGADTPTQTISDEERSAQTIEAVSKLYLLPTGERPTVAQVANIDTLKAQQEFYAKGQNGDMVLLYKESNLAILYRPSVQKLVNVSTVTLQDAEDRQHPD